ncbi:CKLF-like MARVEL transmembrane domain-containing protein 6 [Tiliqua scincoides]|uniref:CKLF-like MARVEL transmembrane domain-containing protein 6 n=1 Tax=Tiliqua scincoides TaxID=71010 RepID=UPI003461F6DD
MENGAPVYAETTVPANEPPGKRASCSVFTAVHLGPRRLLLKALELVLSFLAFICEEVVAVCTSCSSLYFFEFVSCSAFLVSILVLLVYCTSLYEKTGKENVQKLDFYVILALAVLLLLASIVFSIINGKTSAETAAIVFGFLATIAFTVDAVMMIRKKYVVKKEKPEIAANTVNQTENQPLNNPQV